MRILIATCHQSIVGGIEKYLQVLIPALLKRGHAAAVLYEHAASEAADRVDPPDADLPVWYWRNGAGGSSVSKDVAGWRPDVIYSNSVESLEMEEFTLATGPTVFYAHAYHGACATGSKCHSFPRPRPCDRKFGLACLALHYPRRCGGLNPVRAFQMFQTQARHHALLADYRSVLVASRHMHSEFAKQGVGREKLRRVPLPITGIRPANTERAARPPAHSILFAGRLVEAKGVDYLLQAVPLAAQDLGRPLTLTIAGDGPARARLERLAARTGMEARFAGWLETDRRMGAMRQADLLAVPSLWPEPFGLVGIEAGCFALPAVGYAVGGIPDWLIAGQTGEIAPGDPPTVQGLADAIVRALGDREHYARLCRGAWELSSEFTVERHLAQLEPILEAACSPASRVASQPALLAATGNELGAGPATSASYRRT
jgi:glycosyltransferase involved in cell wall biosynthesis